MTLGRNPFEVKEPLEEKPPVRPPKAPTIEPPDVPTGELPPIPQGGLTYTVNDEQGNPLELQILEDFEFVGTERRLRSEDYKVFHEGKEVGRYLRKTGEFQADEPTFWEKTLGIGGKALEWLFVLPSFVGASIGYLGEELKKRWNMTDEEWEAYKKAGLPVASISDLKKFLPGGEFHARLQKSSFWTRLALESPFWVSATVSGVSALRAREAAKALPTALRVPVRAALAPAAGYEWAIGKTIQLTYNTTMSAILRRNLHSWARSAGVQVPKATEDAFVKSALVNLRAKFLAKEALKTLFRPTKAGFIITQSGAQTAETVASQAVRTSPILLGLAKGVTPKVPVVVPPIAPLITPPSAVEVPFIPTELPTTPPALPPEAVTLGRTENEWTGFMADLQDAQTVADVAFRDDAVRRWINLLPETHAFFRVMNPSAIANTPAEQAIIVRAVLRDEGLQKSQGVISFINELGSQEKIFGNIDDKGLIKSGTLRGQSLGDIAEHRPKWETKLTDAQKVWLDRAKVVEDSIIEFLQKNDIDITPLRLEEGGQFATRRVWARTTKDGSVIDTANVGAGPARPGARLPTERHRLFKTEADAIKAGYRYLPYEEALYLKISGAYNRVADAKMADWLLNKVPWRTTGAPEALKVAAESALLQKRHSQQLLSALNRAVRGERVPEVTIRSIARSYPDQAQQLKDLIPRIQRGEPTAREVQNQTRVAKGLVSSNKATSQRAVNARARAREKALSTRYGEATIPAPAFAGKILTGPEAKETANALRKAFDPSFSKAIAEVNKANAVARYFMLAGDFSPFAIQLLFLMGESPKTYGKAFAGSMRALFNTEFHSSYLLKHKATIDKHPNLLLTKSGGTEFTEAMARGGWLSGKTALIPSAENYWKTLGLFLPRTLGKVGATVLTPFQRVFESALDIAGIEMAEAYDYLATTPERTADVDQFINEFRGLTSSARIGVGVLQRQIETGLILAPRYNRAIAGLLYDLGHGGIRGSLARKSLAKGIAALVALSAVISIARGESQEEVLDHYNPNSSNFFTWDVAGQKVGPGTKIRSVVKLFAQSVDNPDSLFELSMDNPAMRFLRGNLSPVVSSGLDLLTGRNYIGDPTRDGMLSFSKEIIAGNLLPIWVQSTLLEGGDVKGRTIRGIAEFFGGRAYPESVWDEVGRLRDKYSQQDFKTKYEDLNRMQIDRLKDNHPDLKDLEGKARLEGAERGNEFERWVFTTREQIVTERNDALERAAVAVNSGLMSKYDYDKERGYARPYYSGGMSVLWLAQESLDPFSVKQLEKWMGENQKPEDTAVDAYQKFRADLIQKADLPKDWDKIEKQSEAYLSRLSKTMRDYIKVNLNRWINDLPENAKQIELMRLEGIEDETWWDDYRGAGTPKRKPLIPRTTTEPAEPVRPPSSSLGVNPFE